jgi:steroid delta-isomerase
MSGAPVVAEPSDPRVARVVRFYEGLAPQDLGRLGEVYAGQAWFKDPFNEVRGLPAIRRIFERMFEVLEAPRFVVTEAVAQGDQAFLAWEFHFRLRRWNRRPQVVRGATHLRFAADGRVAWHRDYWDAAEELYEKLPLLGGLMRWLRRRAGH